MRKVCLPNDEKVKRKNLERATWEEEEEEEEEERG